MAGGGGDKGCDEGSIFFALPCLCLYWVFVWVAYD